MSKTILCIDDSNTALLLLEYTLNEAGYKAITAISIEEAVQILEIKFRSDPA
jgi:DNA-binding NtrC family response regulator